MDLHNGFESVLFLDNGKVMLSKFEEYDISFNKSIGFIEDYFNFSNNSVSIHVLKKKFEQACGLPQKVLEEVQGRIEKIIENFERLDLKKFPMPVLIETLAKLIEEEKSLNQIQATEKKQGKILKLKLYYFLLLVLFYKDRIKAKLIEDYKILLLLNKLKIPQNFEDFLKKENFYENYYNPLANLLSEYYVRNEFIVFYVRLINVYFMKAVIKNSNSSVIDNYSITPKIFVEKSLMKLTAKLAKKAVNMIVPCVKNMMSLNPLAAPITYAVSLVLK
jgi:hypothetical protein